MGLRSTPKRRFVPSNKTNGAQSGRAEWQESRIPNEQGSPRIGPWLDAQTGFTRARHLGHRTATGGQDAIVGGLRLLVQKWTKQDGIVDSDVPVMPFLKTDFDQIMAQLSLPRSFPLDFARYQQIPAETKHISTRHGDRLGWFSMRHTRRPY